MKKRLLACVLVLSLLLNLSVSAFASDLSYYESLGYYPVTITDHFGTRVIYPGDEDYYISFNDISVDPEEYILDSGILSSSLGVTLGFGHIAGLIAAGAGVVFAAEYLDDLGVYLKNALDSAAAAIPNGVDLLAQWTTNAVNGDIALMSAPPWIAKTILDLMYGLVTNTAPLIAGAVSADSSLGVSGMVHSANVPMLESFVYSSSTLDKCDYLITNFDFIPIKLATLTERDDGNLTVTIMSYVVSTIYGTDRDLLLNSTYDRGQLPITPRFNLYSYGGTVNGYGYTYKSMNTTFVPGTEAYDCLFEYVLPGCIVNSTLTLEELVGHYLGDAQLEVDIPIYPYPEGDEVVPDVLVGGLPELWVGQGLGSDVITFPDIMIDGTGVLAPDTTLEGEAAWDVAIDGALEDLKTGELSWSDYWLDISNSVPVAKVEDETTGDIVDRPIGDDGSLKDPVVVPEYSTDPNEYSIDLKRFFPFSIPFDLYNFFCCLASDPETPVFNLSIPFLGYSYDFTVDLSPFDDMAALVRSLELFLFIIVLATTTRDNMIKG